MGEVFGYGLSRTMRVLSSEGCSVEEIALALKKPKSQVKVALRLEPVKVYSRGHANKPPGNSKYRVVVRALHPDWPASGPWLGVSFGPGSSGPEPIGSGSSVDADSGGSLSPGGTEQCQTIAAKDQP